MKILSLQRFQVSCLLCSPSGLRESKRRMEAQPFMFRSLSPSHMHIGGRVVGWLQATVCKSALTWDGYQFESLWISCALKFFTVNIWLICRGTTKGWREATTTEEDEEKRAVWNIWQEFWGWARHGAFGGRHYPFVQCARDSGQMAWSSHPRFNFPRFYFLLSLLSSFSVVRNDLWLEAVETPCP